MTTKRLLIVEDDAPLARVLRDNLKYAGFDVACAGTGEAALEYARATPPDLILLDIMLPGCDGFELCGALRGGGRVPIIMLTARGQRADKLRGLELGADDYITKPFDFEELLARIRAVLRRVRPTVERLELGPIVVDFTRLQAWSSDGELHLTHRELEVLRYLAERRGRVVARDELLREVWGYMEQPNTRSVDHTVARLRKKIEPKPHHPRFIHSVRGDGYCLSAGDGSAGPI